MSLLKAAIVQQSFSFNPKENMEKSVSFLRKAKELNASLAVLPELHKTLYFCQTEDTHFFDLAETIPGPSTDFFGKIAKELHLVLVLSLFEKRAKGLYHNTAVVLEKTGEIAGIYRKMHIPDDPGFYEKFYFTPGDIGFEPISTSIGKLGILICWDQWFPEAARIMALKGADLLIYPTAIGFDPRDSQEEKNRQLEAWITIQRSHGIANALPVISVNRVGIEESQDRENKIDFWGNSFITGPQGEWIVKTERQEDVFVGDIDLNKTEKVRRIWPFLRDRRIDFYQDLTKRYCF